MRVKDFVVTSLMTSLSFLLLSCGGADQSGPGNNSVGGSYFNREQLAYAFVDAVNRYMLGYDLELMKIQTLQDDYYNDFIVVYDWTTDSYDAYDLTDFRPGEDIARYIRDYSRFFYYDLIYLGNNIYEDYYTGTRFNRSATSLNEFIKQTRASEARKERIAESIQTQFSINTASATALADAYLQLTSMPRSQISATMIENLSKKTFGLSLSAIEAQVMAGNISAIEQVMQNMAVQTGTDLEQLQESLRREFDLELNLLKQ